MLQAGGLTNAASLAKVDVARRIIEPDATEAGDTLAFTYSFRLKPDFTIDLTHRRYGNERPQFMVDWASLYHTLCTEGVRPYASSARREDGVTMRGLVLFHEPNGNYVHMLVLSVKPEQLFSDDPKGRVLHADLFTNIPQHNLLNLYEE